MEANWCTIERNIYEKYQITELQIKKNYVGDSVKVFLPKWSQKSKFGI